MALSKGERPGSDRPLCGRSADALWPLVSTGAPPDDHVESCAHCRSALVGLRALDAAAQELAAEDVVVPPTVPRRVMSTVWAEVREGATVPLVIGPDPANVSATAVAAVVRFAVDTMPNARLRAGRCRIEASEGAVDALDAMVEVTVPAGREIDEESLRRRVGMVITAHVGLRLRKLKLAVLSSPQRTSAQHVDEAQAKER